MSMKKEDLEHMTDAIIKALRTQVPIEVDLWGPDEIAAYLKVSRRTVAERYAARPDFPKCYRLPGEKGQLRWKAKEIMAWAEGKD